MRAVLGAAVLASAGCTHVEVLPSVSSGPVREITLPARFDGDPHFLPPSLIEASQPDPPFAYAYQVSYARSDVPPLLAILDPFTYVGMPVGRTRVTATAALEVRDAGTVVKRYEARSVVTQTRNLFSDDSQSVLRGQALSAVRDSIEAQIQADELFLRGMAGRELARGSLE